MLKFLFRRLIGYCIRKAICEYGGPDSAGSILNTASFQSAFATTTGLGITADVATMWLMSHGYHAGYGGCHWFDSSEKSLATFPHGAYCKCYQVFHYANDVHRDERSEWEVCNQCGKEVEGTRFEISYQGGA